LIRKLEKWFVKENLNSGGFDYSSLGLESLDGETPHNGLWRETGACASRTGEEQSVLAPETRADYRKDLP
jgi:hypothetical protein